MRKRSELVFLAAALAALTVFFFKEVIFSNQIFYFRDLWRYFYPLRSYTFALLKQGIAPLWNPFIFCGNPLLATHQTAAFYPISVIYLFGGFDKAFNNFIYLHFVLAGLFFYIFLIDQGISKTASFIGSVTFSFSGYMLATINLLASFASSIWPPLILWAFFRAQKGRSFRYVALCAAFLLFMFLAGEPGMLYIMSFILLALSFRRWKTTWLIFVIFLLLSAFHSIPLAEFFLNTDRARMSYDIATKWSIAPYNFLNLVFPRITDIENIVKDYWDRQSWLLEYYLGLLPLVMLPVAISFGKGTKRYLPLALLAISIVLSLGRYTPIYHVLFHILPAFRFFRYPVKHFYLVTFSLAWLCAIGYDLYERNASSSLRLARYIRSTLYVAFLSGFILLFVDLFFSELAQFAYNSFFLNVEKALKENTLVLPFVRLGLFSIRRTLIFFLVFSLLLFLGTKRLIKTTWISFAVIVVVLADLYYALYPVDISFDIEKLKEPSGNIQFLMQDKGLFRMLSSPANNLEMARPNARSYEVPFLGEKERLYSNMMMIYGIYDAGGYDSLERERITDILRLINIYVKHPDQTQLLNAINVKYVISPKIFEAKGYKLVKKSDIANIYENRNVLPRAFLSDSALVIKDRKKILDKFLDMDWDPRKEVILEEEPIVKYQSIKVSKHQRGEGKVDITKYSPKEVLIKTTVNSPKFLVLSDSHYPGWKVYVDGKRDRLYLANYAFRAVHLDSGEHIVRFAFDPFSFKLGLSLTAIGVILVIILFLRNYMI